MSLKLPKAMYEFLLEHESDIKKAYKTINKRRKSNLSLAIPNGDNLTPDSFIRITFKGNSFIEEATDSDSEEDDYAGLIYPHGVGDDAENIPLAQNNHIAQEPDEIVILNVNQQLIPVIDQGPVEAIVDIIQHHANQVVEAIIPIPLTTKLETIYADLVSKVRDIDLQVNQPLLFNEFSVQDYSYESLRNDSSISQHFHSTLESSISAELTSKKSDELNHVAAVRYFNSQLSKQALINRIKDENPELNVENINYSLGNRFAEFKRAENPDVGQDTINDEWGKILSSTTRGNSLKKLMHDLGLGRQCCFF